MPDLASQRADARFSDEQVISNTANRHSFFSQMSGVFVRSTERIGSDLGRASNPPPRKRRRTRGRSDGDRRDPSGSLHQLIPPGSQVQLPILQMRSIGQLPPQFALHTHEHELASA